MQSKGKRLLQTLTVTACVGAPWDISYAMEEMDAGQAPIPQAADLVDHSKNASQATALLKQGTVVRDKSKDILEKMLALTNQVNWDTVSEEDRAELNKKYIKLRDKLDQEVDRLKNKSQATALLEQGDAVKDSTKAILEKMAALDAQANSGIVNAMPSKNAAVTADGASVPANKVSTVDRVILIQAITAAAKARSDTVGAGEPAKSQEEYKKISEQLDLEADHLKNTSQATALLEQGTTVRESAIRILERIADWLDEARSDFLERKADFLAKANSDYSTKFKMARYSTEFKMDCMSYKAKQAIFKEEFIKFSKSLFPNWDNGVWGGTKLLSDRAYWEGVRLFSESFGTVSADELAKLQEIFIKLSEQLDLEVDYSKNASQATALLEQDTTMRDNAKRILTKMAILAVQSRSDTVSADDRAKSEEDYIKLSEQLDLEIPKAFWEEPKFPPK